MPAPKGYKTAKKIMPRGKAKRTCANGSYGMTPDRKGTRVLVCCRKGKWNQRTRRCREATKAVEVFKRKR